METAQPEAQLFRLWVDWDQQVISFHPVSGFQMMEFPSREHLLAFAMVQGHSGFRIQ